MFNVYVRNGGKKIGFVCDHSNRIMLQKPFESDFVYAIESILIHLTGKLWNKKKLNSYKISSNKPQSSLKTHLFWLAGIKCIYSF